MKYSKLIISLAVLFASIHAHGVTITTSGPYQDTNVGDTDTFLGVTTDLSNSNPVTEKTWAESISDTMLTYVNKAEGVAIYETNNASVYAFELNSPINYYIVKNSKAWALYENNQHFSWAVFTATSELNIGDMEISHYTSFNDTPADNIPTVPDSGATVALMGIALAGLGFLKRCNG